MEREGEGIKKRGSEMRRGKRGIIVGGMILGLLISCNNGGEDPQKVFLKSVVGLGNDFLNIFTSFGDVLGSTLGLNKDSKKSDVANYFKNIQDTVQRTKESLKKIVDDMKNDNNPNVSKTEDAVTDLNKKLNKIIQGAETASGAIGTDANESIANVADQDAGVAGTGVDNLVNGIKSIVEVVLKEQGDPDAGDDKGPVKDNGSAGDKRTATSGSTDGNAGKLFASDHSGSASSDAAKAARDAIKAVGTVTGAGILKAMAQVDGNAAKLAKNATDNAASVSAAEGANDATISAAIVLRAIANKGKFAGPQGGKKADVTTTVKRAAVSAVTKALDTLTIAIRRTIDEELKKVKEAMNINPETTPVNSEGTTNK